MRQVGLEATATQHTLANCLVGLDIGGAEIDKQLGRIDLWHGSIRQPGNARTQCQGDRRLPAGGHDVDVGPMTGKIFDDRRRANVGGRVHRRPARGARLVDIRSARNQAVRCLDRARRFFRCKVAFAPEPERYH